MESSLDLVCIYLDFSKAFDCVFHTNLIFKLSQIGIHGCIEDKYNQRTVIHFILVHKSVHILR